MSAAPREGRADERGRARARARGRRGRRRRSTTWRGGRSPRRPRIGRADESTRGRGRRARERARVSGREARARAAGTAEARTGARRVGEVRGRRTRRGGGAGGDTPAASVASRRRARSARAIVGTSLPTIRDPGAAGSFARPWCVSRFGRARPHLLAPPGGPARGTPAVPGPRRDVRCFLPSSRPCAASSPRAGRSPPSPSSRRADSSSPCSTASASRSRPRDRTSAVTSSASRSARATTPPCSTSRARRWPRARTRATPDAAKASSGSSASWCAANLLERANRLLPLAPHPTTPFPDFRPPASARLASRSSRRRFSPTWRRAEQRSVRDAANAAYERRSSPSTGGSPRARSPSCSASPARARSSRASARTRRRRTEACARSSGVHPGVSKITPSWRKTD